MVAKQPPLKRRSTAHVGLPAPVQNRCFVCVYISPYRETPLRPVVRARAQRTPMGGRGAKLLWLLCAEFSDSTVALSPLPALALALPVRLRT